MKRFTFKVKNYPLAYISYPSIDCFITQIVSSLKTDIELNSLKNAKFTYNEQSWLMSDITKVLVRCPKNYKTIIYCDVTNPRRPFWYVIDKKKINIKNYLGSNDNLFDSQEKCLKLITDLDVGQNINLDRYTDEILLENNLNRAEFMAQVMTLCEAKLIQPVYKLNTLENLKESHNEWTPLLNTLSQDFTTESGTIISGKDFHNILINFRRIN